MKTLQQIDAEIAQCEQQLEVLHEQRREWVNHLGLNKPQGKTINNDDFHYHWNQSFTSLRCTHLPTGKTNWQHKQLYKELTHEDACAPVVAELLAEGWVHAS